METVLSAIIAITAIILIVTVVLTESDQAGLGTLSGAETAWGEHKGSSKKDIQNKIIIVSSIVFAVAILVLAVF
ncbi:preprotein translocase subunit SecG [Anaerosphaera multitolerans]|uniref:Protein-export membrane protein SecG n=1 Tax=Anaerosphaera multitolerans TaxID=2487351 RepID=A0A437S4L6_9FIRM|nr:preprotein translocase subunit SecG [Anaerosphaera multitolerans]RVU53959.1 preprotein translocase subunit SecG [Anaerosphaera multitolerans]